MKTQKQIDANRSLFEAKETRNYKRVQERQLQRQLDADIAGARHDSNNVDTRHNPDKFSEDWALGNQLEHGPRITPHVGA